MNRRHFLLAIAMFSASRARAAGEDPVAIVTKIYKFSAGKKGDFSGQSAFLDSGIRRAYFSAAFLATIMRMDKKSTATNESILDFDPVTASQDPSVKRLKITGQVTGADEFDVAATFYAFDNTTPSVVHYIFITESGGWRVDDITGDVEGEKWSVRQIARQ